MKAADHIAATVAAQGVTLAFEVVGGTIAPAIDAFHTAGDVRLISMRHEQAAAFAAEGAARMTGVPGFAMATSGPGATNLLTGVASCYFDSTPAVFLCGQVTTADLRGDRPVRQRGFQETDVVAMAAPIAKAAWRVRDEEELPELLAAAFALAREGRPGPVLLDVPMDLQGRDVTPPGAPAVGAPRATPNPAAVDRVLAALAAAQRPLILAGGGLRGAGATAALARFAQRAGAPVVHSLMGVDVLPADHPLRVGMIGTYGNRWANIAIARSDLIVVLGSRLDIRQTGADVEGFAAGREIHHVDCDAAELNHRITGCHAVEAGLAEFLAIAEGRRSDGAVPDRSAWLAELADLRARWPDTAELHGVPGINPNAFMHALGAASRTAAAYVVDVGQHQMWAAQSLAPAAGQRFLTSGGLGAMGFALPAAIGAALAVDAPVVAIAGDGGFQLNLQELQTVVETGAPVKIVILDNGVHGMVRQFQESYFDGRFPSSDWGYSAPDFARVAQAYTIASTVVTESADLAPALQETFHDPRRPHLLVVRIDAAANAYPKLAFGRPITEMEPLATPLPLQR
jgi:acetolactate synthase I/II/III large subunit